MNKNLQSLYEATVTKLNNFEEPICYKKNVLQSGIIFREYEHIDDHLKIFKVIEAEMLEHGVELTIRNTKTLSIEKGTVLARYVTIKCALSKKVSDAKLALQREQKIQMQASQSDGKEAQESVNSRNTKTKRIADCPCEITLNYRSDTREWKVGKVCNSQHTGHPRKLIQIREISADQKMQILRLRSDGLSVYATMNHLERVSSLQLTSTQIYNISQSVLDACGEIIHDSSKSGELLQYLNGLKNVVYIAKFTIRKKDSLGSISGELCQVKIPGHNPYDKPDRFSDLCIQDLLNIGPNQLSRVMPPKDSKANSSYVYELNAITWVTREVLKVANRFPEVLMTDATAKTNSSNRPLIFVCGVDSTHRTICVSSSLTSNECKDSFRFIIENLKLLYGKQWTSRVKVFLSDGASEITETIESKIRTGIFNPDVTRRFLCHYHAVNLKGLKDLASLNGEYENSLKNVMYRLIYRGFRELETQEESKIYFRAVEDYFKQMLNQSKLSEETHEKFKRFLDAVLGNAAQLSNVYSHGVFHLGIRTTGRNEAENWGAKSAGINPKTAIAKLATFDVKRSAHRTYEQNIRFQREAITQPVNAPQAYKEISAKITSKAWELLESQIRVHLEYNIETLCKNPLEFQVTHKTNTRKQNYHEIQKYFYEIPGKDSIEISLPKFYRSRTVHVEDGYLKCSCSYFSCFGIPCRHMIAINKGVISETDIHLRWTTAYSQGAMDEFLDKVDLSMSPGAICRASSEDFPEKTSIEESDNNDIIEQDDLLAEDCNDAHDIFACPNADADDIDDLNEERECPETQECPAPPENLCGKSTTSKLNYEQRYAAHKSLASQVDRLASEFALNPEASAFFRENLEAFLSACNNFKAKAQNFSYENLEDGAVSDPLIIKSSLRTSRRSKAPGEVSNRGKRRHSQFIESSNIVEPAMIQFESTIRTKGRPRAQDNNE
jgi:hypothetical protein